MNNNLQRMIVIPPDVFDKWKHIITEDEKLTQLDKKMKNIIYNKNLNDIDKWHQYRENLLKYSFAKKGNEVLNHTMKKITSEKSMQTNRIPKLNKKQQTDQQFQISVPIQSDQASQTDNEVQNFENDEEVFETQDHSFSDDATELDTDDNTRKLALKGFPENIRITKERRSTDPSSYKSFELSNGDVVSVPTKITTRSMKKSAESKIKRQKSPLKQQQLPFLKVKAPHIRPRANSGKVKGSPNKSPSKTTNLLKWDQY